MIEHAWHPAELLTGTIGICHACNRVLMPDTMKTRCDRKWRPLPFFEAWSVQNAVS